MSAEKPTATKQSAKKAVVVAETVKPKKTVTASSAKSTASEKTTAATASAKAVSKAPAASKATKAPTVPKATSTTSENTVSGKKATGTSAPAKAVSKAPIARKTATATPKDEVKKKAPAAKNLIKKPSAPSHEERQRWIATAAYHRAENRGFAPGYEVQDWLDAEAEITELIGKA